jgi:hypothetical protein
MRRAFRQSISSSRGRLSKLILTIAPLLGFKRPVTIKRLSGEQMQIQGVDEVHEYLASEGDQKSAQSKALLWPAPRNNSARPGLWCVQCRHTDIFPSAQRRSDSCASSTVVVAPSREVLSGSSSSSSAWGKQVHPSTRHYRTVGTTVHPPIPSLAGTELL